MSESARQIAYTSPFVPRELIVAHGFGAVRIVPGAGGGAARFNLSGVCPFAANTAELLGENAQRFAGAVVANTCDQMRRIAEFVEADSVLPIFRLDVPAVWTDAESHAYYSDELRRLRAFLARCGGSPCDDGKLVAALRGEQRTRERIRAAEGAIDSLEFAGMLERYYAIGAAPAVVAEAVGKRVPLALVGGPIPKNGGWLHKSVEDFGGRIVVDASETGTRTFPGKFDERRLRENPLGELADKYFGAIPDIFQRPNTQLFEYVRDRIIAAFVRGIIFVRHTWCDLWHAELARFREWTKLPVLDLELDGEQIRAKAGRTRIAAFMESLRHD